MRKILKSALKKKRRSAFSINDFIAAFTAIFVKFRRIFCRLFDYFTQILRRFHVVLTSIFVVFNLFQSVFINRIYRFFGFA